MFNALSSSDSQNQVNQLEPRLLLTAIPLLIEILSYIFNLKVETESIPDLWKVACVLPLSKVGVSEMS